MGMNAKGQNWPHNHAPENPLFFETLEASIRHTWVDKSRCSGGSRSFRSAEACLWALQLRTAPRGFCLPLFGVLLAELQ